MVDTRIREVRHHLWLNDDVITVRGDVFGNISFKECVFGLHSARRQSTGEHTNDGQNDQRHVQNRPDLKRTKLISVNKIVSNLRMGN